MSRVVWKFPLPVSDPVRVPMPVGAAVLHVGAQGDQACLWALCDPAASLEDRLFYVRTTGQRLDVREAPYLGTFMLEDGAFVGHVFGDPRPS